MDKMEIILGLCHENAEIKMIQQLFFKSVLIKLSCLILAGLRTDIWDPDGKCAVNDEIIWHAKPGFLWA